MYPSLQYGDSERVALRLWCSYFSVLSRECCAHWDELSMHHQPSSSFNSHQSLSYWDISLRVDTFLPFSSLISHLTVFPQHLSSFSSPSLRPSVSLHISLGLVPVIKHSCRAHRTAPLFFTLLYKLAGCLFLRPWPCWFWLTSVTLCYWCCLCPGHRADSAVSTECSDSTSTYAYECACLFECAPMKRAR